MNAHLFLIRPDGFRQIGHAQQSAGTWVGRSPAAVVHRGGNSFGLFSDFARRLGLTVNRGQAGPGSASAYRRSPTRRLIETPAILQTLDADALDEDHHRMPQPWRRTSTRRAGRTGITARLMITGGEDKEEARMTRADRSLIRQCILDAAEHCG